MTEREARFVEDRSADLSERGTCAVPAAFAPRLSLVVPVYNEEALATELVRRVRLMCEGLAAKRGWRREQVEVLFVNDGSRDRTLELLLEACADNPMLAVVNLSRNHGHQLAITAGIDLARGDAVAVMDGDLQDPPEVIPELYAKLAEGFDVVYAVRRHRAGETRFKKWTAALFYRLLRNLTNVDIPVDTGDFRIMSRRVVDAFKQLRERHRFIRGLVSWLGFKQVGLLYDRAERSAGETKYPLKRMIKFAIDGITSFSSLPLRMASFAGTVAATAGVLYGLYVIYLGLFSPEVVSGWSSLMVVVLFLGGVQLFALGLIGEYLGRVSDEIKQRPLYMIESVVRGGSLASAIALPAEEQGRG